MLSETLKSCGSVALDENQQCRKDAMCELSYELLKLKKGFDCKLLFEMDQAPVWRCMAEGLNKESKIRELSLTSSFI